MIKEVMCPVDFKFIAKPVPSPGKYKLYIHGIVIKEEKIDVPEHYGE